MLKFYETYADNEKLSTVWSELSWSINRKIMSIKDAIKQYLANLNGRKSREYEKRLLGGDR